MRVLSVAEINLRVDYRYRVVSPPPVRDPILPRYLEDEVIDEEIAILINSSNPINVAPLIVFGTAAAYGSPEPLFQELVPELVEEEEEDVCRLERQKRLRQAEARAVEEEEMEAVRARRDAEEEEEAARLRLLHEAESGSEEEDDNNNEVIVGDSGVDSVDSDTESMEVEEEEQDIDSSSSSGDSVSSSTDSEAEDVYDPARDPEREALLHRLLGFRKNLWRVRQSLLRLKRRRDLIRMNNKIRRARERRMRFLRNLSRTERRNLPVPQIERPRRNRDFCYGCGRFYLTQRVRWWWRCNMCGFWLCPDCNVDPLHCQRNQII